MRVDNRGTLVPEDDPAPHRARRILRPYRGLERVNRGRRIVYRGTLIAADPTSWRQREPRLYRRLQRVRHWRRVDNRGTLMAVYPASQRQREARLYRTFQRVYDWRDRGILYRGTLAESDTPAWRQNRVHSCWVRLLNEDRTYP